MQAQDKIILDKMLTSIAEQRASDLHFLVGSPPVLRTDGRLKPLTNEIVITSDFIEQVVFSILNKDQQEKLTKEREIVIGYDFKPGLRFRVSVFYQKGNLSASFRLIVTPIKTLKELGMPAVVQEFVKSKKGLLLVSGPFASGKSTVIAAMIETINKSKSRHIVTLEEPIEYVFTNDKSIIEQREIGRDVTSVMQGLEFLEEGDADVIVTPEVEEPEVFLQLLDLAESGRFVISQLALDSVHKAMERINNIFPKDKQDLLRLMLGDNLVGILSLRLLPRLGGGLISIPEVLKVNSAVRSIIKEGKYYQLRNLMQISQAEGMKTFDQSLVELVSSGQILLEVALEQASDPASFRTTVR
ncbi:Flp pilus assembly complex ATPase component TadA [Patescibacteria group bacterium]|nr:Flp pilus assembly complex ATPase component TadA [Patescibacteria group bacterium]MBU4511960.1 Flp pilus assembly complex ATPase component TadA [Patescibacteria group bacterium]MCG2693364.1 Flp pilus assembly complex ATPase component TadA [Candidatus Parcubacteria bacterium]